MQLIAEQLNSMWFGKAAPLLGSAAGGDAGICAGMQGFPGDPCWLWAILLLPLRMRLLLIYT